MEQNKYTGELAGALSMLSLVSAMGTANIMQKKPDLMLEKLLLAVGQRVKERAPKEALEVWGNPMFREIMREFIGQCGLTTMAVLQVYKKFDNECKRNKNVC
jgi:hypothetical protein